MLCALNSTNHASADLLLLLADEEERVGAADDPKKVPPPFRFTGDGLSALSGLIVSGIVEIGRRFSGVNAWGPSMPSFEVRLTDKGRKLVAAWREGAADLDSVLDNSGSEI
jgi:hypothetical protein